MGAVALVVAVSCSTGVSGSSKSADPSSPVGTGGAGVALLRTPAEKHFGRAPTPSKDVTYADDVVLLPDGPESIVAVSNSGATVVLQPDAPGVDDLDEGEILFATGRVVGRIAGMRTTDDGVEVALLPVRLTDVVEHADLEWDQPVDPSSMLVYEGQNLGGDATDAQADPDVADGSELVATTDADGNVVEPETDDGDAAGGTDPTEPSTSTGGDGESSAPARDAGHAEPIARRRPAADADEPDATTTTAPTGAGAVTGEGDGAAAGSVPGTESGSDDGAPDNGSGDGGGGGGAGGPAAAAAGAPVAPPAAFPGKPVRISGFRITPISSGGVGVKLTYDSGGTKVLAQVKLKLQSPKVHAGIVIDHGELRSASLTLTGAAGIAAQFDAGTENGIDGNIHEYVDVPVDISIPLGGPLPLSMTWRQTFILKTAFSAKTGTLSARGDYSFTGGLGFRYSPGNITVYAPADAKAESAMVDNLDGASVGVSGLVLAYRARMIVGIGAFGFTSGLETTTTASWGVSRASDIGGIPCRRVDITLDGTAGVGWSIPKPLAAAINFFLQLFDAEIPSSGGIRSSPVTIAEGTGILPDIGACGGGS